MTSNLVQTDASFGLGKLKKIAGDKLAGLKEQALDKISEVSDDLKEQGMSAISENIEDLKEKGTDLVKSEI